VVANGKLALKAQPNVSSFHYDLNELRDWLESYCSASALPATAVASEVREKYAASTAAVAIAV